MRLTALVFLTAILLASCSGFLKGKSSGFNKVMKSTDYEYKLKMADKYFADKDYDHAQQLYDDLFRVMKGSDHFESIYYNFAYCAFYLKDYMNAENLFKGFVEAFPNSPKAEEMDYMRAFTFYKQSPKGPLDQTNTTKTIGFMQAFIATHPGSAKIKDATDIIEKCRAKLEQKESDNGHLYYDLGQFRAAAITFTTLMNTYPDSEKSDEYKFFIIKSYYEFAQKSVEVKKEARYEQVVTECNDFVDRFPDSKLLKEVQVYLNLSTNNVKSLKNE